MSMLGLERRDAPLDAAAAVTQRAPDESTQPVARPEKSRSAEDGHFDQVRPDANAVAARLQLIFGSRFQVVKTLAIGGMATILQLQHRLHGGLFVAKVLHPELAVRPGVLHSFRTEAINAARVGDHPNAVPVFDFGELDGLFFMLMPFIPGEDLDKILERMGPLQPAEVLQLAAQISSLLSHAESLGIVHCDVTPGNIRLDSFGNYRLLDFGISQSGEPDVRPLRGGTPLYASPEQLQGKAVDTRSDLYSLGAVMAEALTGSPLFQGDSMADIKQKHLDANWQMPPMLPDRDPIRRLLPMLLATDTSERLSSAFELSGILDALGHARPEFRNQLTTTKKPAVAPTRRRLSE